jgi:hypothetical protein
MWQEDEFEEIARMYNWPKDLSICYKCGGKPVSLTVVDKKFVTECREHFTERKMLEKLSQI